MEYGAVLHSSYSTLPEGMKFTLLVFSCTCKQHVDIVAARSSHSTHTVYNIALEPGTGTGLREIDVHGQRSSVPGKSLKDGPKTAVSCWCSSKNERCQVLPKRRVLAP